MMSQTTNNMLMVVFIALSAIFAPVAMDAPLGNEAIGTNEPVPMEDCDTYDEFRITPNLHHVDKMSRRAVRQFSLKVAKKKAQFKRKVWKLLSPFIKAKNADCKPVCQEDDSICPICLDVESNTAPHFTNGLCADCNIDEGYLVAENRSTAAISAIVASVLLMLFVAMVAPKLAFSVPVMTLRTRKPMPAKLKIINKHDDFKVRKNSKEPKYCVLCPTIIDNGDYMIMAHVDSPKYTQRKPHCEQCGIAAWQAAMAEPAPKSEPVSEPEPATEPSTVVLKEPKPEPKTEPISASVTSLGSVLSEPTHFSPSGKAVTASKLEQGAQLMEIIANLGGVDEEKVRQIVEQHTKDIEEKFSQQIDDELKKINKPTVLAIKTGKGEPMKIKGVQHHKMTELLWRITQTANDNNLYLHGDAGTGKTRICVDLFGLLVAAGFFKGHGVKKPTVEENVFILSCNKDIQSQELIGRESPRFFDDGSGRPAGEWDFIKGAILPVFEKGGLIVLDEIDRLHESTLSALNAILANGFIYTPKGEKVLRHPSTVIVGTANTTGYGSNPKYAAARQQDGATLDRFTGNKIHIHYDPAIEDSVAGSTELAQKFRDMRTAFENHGLDEAIISYRSIIVTRGHIEAGASQDWALYQIASQWGEENAIKAGYTTAPEMDFSEPTLWGAA